MQRRQATVLFFLRTCLVFGSVAGLLIITTFPDEAAPVGAPVQNIHAQECRY